MLKYCSFNNTLSQPRPRRCPQDPDFRRWILCHNLMRIPVLQQGHDFLVIVHLVQHYHVLATLLSPCPSSTYPERNILHGLVMLKFNFRFFIKDAKIFAQTASAMLGSNFVIILSRQYPVQSKTRNIILSTV